MPAFLRFRDKFVHSFVTDFYHVFFHSTRALMKKQVQIGVKSDDFFHTEMQIMPSIGVLFIVGHPLSDVPAVLSLILHTSKIPNIAEKNLLKDVL